MALKTRRFPRAPRSPLHCPQTDRRAAQITGSIHMRRKHDATARHVESSESVQGRRAEIESDQETLIVHVSHVSKQVTLGGDRFIIADRERRMGPTQFKSADTAQRDDRSSARRITLTVA